MITQRKRFCWHTFSWNGNVVTLVAKSTAPKPNVHTPHSTKFTSCKPKPVIG